MKYDIVRLMPIAYCNKSGNNIIRKNCISVWYFSMVIYIIYSRKDYLPETPINIKWMIDDVVDYHVNDHVYYEEACEWIK